MVKSRPFQGNSRHIRRNAVPYYDSCAGKKIHRKTKNIIFPAWVQSSLKNDGILAGV